MDGQVKIKIGLPEIKGYVWEPFFYNCMFKNISTNRPELNIMTLLVEKCPIQNRGTVRGTNSAVLQ